jgi:alkylhydroperoxidase family enzyme
VEQVRITDNPFKQVRVSPHAFAARIAHDAPEVRPPSSARRATGTSWPSRARCAGAIGNGVESFLVLQGDMLPRSSTGAEAPGYTRRERAALAWTESLTLLPETGAPDDVYVEVERNFTPRERVALTLAIVAINGWDRLSVGFRRPAGDCVSHRRPGPVRT